MSCITPHLGYVSEQNYRAYFAGVVEDIRGFLDGKPVRVMYSKLQPGASQKFDAAHALDRKPSHASRTTSSR